MAEAACLTESAYHPRRARDSSLYRLAETHYETFKQLYDERFAARYGAWRVVVERTLFAFLDCGIEERGFARVRCDVCRREFRVALSCKTRGFCTSCHAKRAVLWANRSEAAAGVLPLRPAPALCAVALRVGDGAGYVLAPRHLKREPRRSPLVL